MSEEVIKYGDIVSIHGLQPNLADPSKEIKGLLISKGFTDTNLFFAYNNLDNISRQELFRVLPKSSFEIHDEATSSEEDADIESRKEKEVEQFVNNIKLMEGGDIHFGEYIILNHVASGSYLRGCFICGEAGFGSFKLELTNDFSSDILFRVETYRSFEKEGEKFRLKTPFRLHHFRSNSYLNYIEKEIFLSKKYDDIHPINEIRQPVRHPTINQSKTKLILWMEPHFKLESGRVQHQDVVYLQYSKCSGYLSCDIDENRVFIKINKKGGICYDALWEVCYQGDTAFLRHYLYKKTLVLDAFGKIELHDSLDRKLSLKAVVPHAGDFENRELVNLKHESRLLACRMPMQKVYLNKLLEYCEKNYSYQTVQMLEEDAAEDSFKLIKLEPADRELIDYLLSSTELLVKVRCFLSSGTERSFVEEFIIKNFNAFLQESIQTTLEKLRAKLSGSKPSYKVASVMRDLKVIDLVVDIIVEFGTVYPILKDFDEFSGKGNQIDSLVRIFELCYQILLELCVFPDIKIYASQWLHIFLQQFYAIKEPFVENFLWKVFENNHISITSEIRKSDIGHAAESFITSTSVNSGYIKLVRCFCYCGKESIRSNQDAVKALLFREENKYLMRFRLREEVIFVEYLQRQYLLLEFFEQYRQTEVWRYFYQYLQLLADISIHQNSENIKYISQHLLNYETICALLNSPDVREIDRVCKQHDLRRITNPLIRVVHCCYIDVQGFETIRRIAKVREWKDIHKKNVILKSHSTKKQNELVFIKKVLAFIVDYLKEVRATQDFEESRALASLLDLLRGTITIGFWEDIEQFRELIPLLIRIVKYDSNRVIEAVEEATRGRMITRSQMQELVQSKKAELNRRISKEHLECKIKSLDILDIMMDMETNTRVSLLTYFFKGVYWYTIDFDRYMRPVELEFSSTQEQKTDENLMGTLMRQLKHKKEPDLFDNENLWINRMRELTPIEREQVDTKSKRYLFDRFDHIQDVFLALMELSEYHNYELMNYGLLILSRIFGQRKDLINNFENVIIVAEGNFNKLSKKSREEIRSKLKFLEIPNIRELTREKDEKEAIRIWKPYRADEQCEEKKKSGVIQDLCYLIEMMKTGRAVDDNSLKNLYKYEALGSTLTIYNEREYPCALYQKLIKNQDSHLVLLKYIELINNPDSNEIHLKCLHAIYNYLTMLIWNHPKNKADLTSTLKLVTKHLRWNIGVADFIRELFKNNKILIKSDISWFIEMLLEEVRLKPTSDYYASKLLDIFRMLTLFNEKGVKKNQLEILSAFQRTKFQILDLSNLDEQLEVYSKGLTRLMDGCPSDRHQEYFARNKLPISSELTFVVMFFQSFSCLIESKHQVNIGKCSNIHPYLDILALIEKSEKCWPLLRHLRGYINRLYYIPVEYDILMFEEFIKRELNNLAAQLKAYIEDFEEDFDRHSLIEIEFPVRFTFLASYTYCAFIEMLTSFYSMVSKPKFCDHLKHCMRNSPVVLDQVLSLMELFGYVHLRIIKRKSKSKFLICYLREIKGCLLTFLDTVTLKQMEQRYDKKEFSYEEGEQEIENVSAHFFYDYSKTFFRNFIEMITCHKINKMREELIRSLTLRNQRMNVDEFTKKIKYVDLMFTRVIKRFEKYRVKPVDKSQEQGPAAHDQTKIIAHQSRSFNVLGKQELSHDQENSVLNDIHEKICQNMQNEEVYRSYKENEFMHFVKLFFDFDRIESEFYVGKWRSIGYQQDSLPIVTIKNFVTSVVDMIKTSPDSIKNDSKIEFVRILRLFISETGEEGQEKLPVDKWTADYVPDQFKQKLARSQELLIEANCHELIFAIFKQRLNDNLVLLNELLLLTIALLFGGNRVCQEALLQEMIRDKDNLMLSSIEDTMRYLGDELFRLTKIRETLNSHNNFHVTHEDTYDYFNIKDRVMERKFIYCYDPIAEKAAKRQKSNALNRIFRFMQLLCENNNVEMKKFIRLQCDENGQPRANSINFIEKTTLLLRRFFKIMNVNILAIPLFLLDFVNEVTQLPCVDNQVTFCKSTFLEDLCFMETFMTREKQITMLIESKENVDELFEIYNKSVSLVLSNMEGNDDTIFEQIRNKLTLGFLGALTLYNFRECLDHFGIAHSVDNDPITPENVNRLKEAIKKSELPEHYLNIINILSVLHKENDRRRQGQEDRLAEYISRFPALQVIKQDILRIEINLFSRQYIYFARHPLFGCLSRQTRKQIMQTVDRDTQRDKLNGLIGYADEVIEEMEMFQNMTTSSYTYWRSAALILSFIVQIFVLFMISIELGPDEFSLSYRSRLWWLVVKLLSIGQLGCSVYYFVEWVRVRSDLAVKKHTRQLKNTTLVEEGENQPSRLRKKLEPILRKWFVFVSLCKHESEFISIVLFMLASALGTFVGPQFYALLLLEPFSRIAIMKSVFQAVIFNAKQLLTVSLLGVFFVYTFSLVALAFNILELPEKKQSCDNVMDCVLSIYVSGTISEEMEHFQFAKFLAGLIYIVVMELLFSNIVSGIMIDTFAELRDRKKQIIEDMKNMCFICGMSRSQADKKDKDFDLHIKQEHFLWNYIFYIYCLRNKDETDYTGIEYSISEKLEKEDLSWIPIEEEMGQDEATKEEDTVEPYFEEIKQKLRTLERRS